MMAALYVADLDEFRPVVEGCRKAGHRVQGPRAGYWSVESDGPITLERKAMGLGPALWYTCLAGGIRGQVLEYGRERLVIGDAP